jgi:hypothetical protein
LVGCAFGGHSAVCSDAAAVAETALPPDHAPITAVQISNSETLSICHFGDPAWTPSPSNPEDSVGCWAIADLSMGSDTVSVVLEYDYAIDHWRAHSIR